MRRFLMALAGTAVCALISNAALAVGPITFSEPEFPGGTIVNGLSVTTLNGVPLPGTLQFGYSSNSMTVSGGPGSVTYVQDPSLQGPTGTMTIDFGVNVTSASFGFALLTNSAVTGAAVIQVYDSYSNLLKTVSVDATLVDPFAEAQAIITSSVPFRRLVIAFDTTPPAVAFDNLSYTPGGIQDVPALGTGALLALGALLAAAGFLLVRRLA